MEKIPNLHRQVGHFSIIQEGIVNFADFHKQGHASRKRVQPASSPQDGPFFCGSVSAYDVSPYIEKTSYFLYNNKIMSRCFTMLKPGVVNRRLVGEVIGRLEK